MPDLSQAEIRRYSRHLLLPEVGVQGQEKLKASSVLIVGAGGLGSPLALYLAAAGVGRIGLVDFDVVDESNLQRQVIHHTEDVGKAKLASAERRIHSVNPEVSVDLHPVRLSSENALEIVSDYDIVADGTDNFPTRYLINDSAILSGIPNVSASVFRFEGQVAVFGAPDGPCYRCLYPIPPPPELIPSCAEGGVLGVLPGMVGTLQATEVLKMLLGIGKPLIGRLLIVDALAMSFHEVGVARNPDCPVCSPSASQRKLVDYQAFCGVSPKTQEAPEISVSELRERQEAGEAIALLDVRSPQESAIASLGGTLIPLAQLERRIEEIRHFANQTVVVYCRTGARSANAVATMERHGFGSVLNLGGGIRAWSEQIDSTIPIY